MLTISLFAFIVITSHHVHPFGPLLTNLLSYYFCWPEYGPPSVLMLLCWGSEFPVSLSALLLMVSLVIAGAYQSSQGNSSENDPNNTTVSKLFFSQRGGLGIAVTLSFIILQ